MKILQTIVADEGMTIAKKDSNEILGEKIPLAVNDDPENYIEVEKPICDINEFPE